MKYDFETILERKGKDAIAVDNVGFKMWGNEPDAPKDGFSFIPMWVADMNFATCPAVIDAISARLTHPTFGYHMTRDEYYERIIQWQKTMHQATTITKEMINYQNSVHGCITSAVSVLSQPDDPIFVHRPRYVGFASDIEMLGRHPVYSDLVKDENGIYRMNYEEMEDVISKNNVHLAIFCSPHNPAGRVWEKWELEKAFEIFEKYHVFVISDEIWADLTYGNYQHTPSYEVNAWAKDHVISIYALGKTFNLAGFNVAYSVIPGKYLRDRVVKYASATHLNGQSILDMYAQIGAYSKTGYEWTKELKSVLEENCRYVVDYINNEVDGVSVTMPEGTYMLFLDLKEYLDRTHKTLDQVIKAGWDVGVGWQDGRGFGGLTHIRMNLASPKSMIEEAVARLKSYVFNE